MRVKILLVLLVLLSIEVVADAGPLYVYDAICEKDGSMDIIFGSRTTNKIYTGDINIRTEYIGDNILRKPKFDVEGNWNYEIIKDKTSSITDRTTLFTEEAVFNLTGEYILIIDYKYDNNPYNIQHEVRCPGFEFSCKLLGVYVDYCKNINNERFEASARILGLGEVTKENLSLNNNIEFMLQANKDYMDIRGKISDKGSLPKNIEINNPKYGQYYFNLSWNSKIKKFVAKFKGINYIESGCLNYPNISLYSYKECEDVIISETVEKSEENEQIYTGRVVSEQEEKVLEELEKNVSTKKEKRSSWHFIILILVFVLCVVGILYIIMKRNFNKEPSL